MERDELKIERRWDEEVASRRRPSLETGDSRCLGFLEASHMYRGGQRDETLGLVVPNRNK